MPELLTLISSVIGLLTIAHFLNKIFSSLTHRLKYHAWPMSALGLELMSLKEKHGLLLEQYRILREENEKLSGAVIGLIQK